MCALRKVGYFRPVFPDIQGDYGNYCVPRHRTAQILTQSQTSDSELKQTMFHTKNARLPSKGAVFSLWIYAPPVVGGVQGSYGKANLRLAAVPTLCSAETPPRSVRIAIRGCQYPVDTGGY